MKNTIKKIRGLVESKLLDIKADKECRQLQVIADSLRKRFRIDEVEALNKGLDILEDLKQGGLIR